MEFLKEIFGIQLNSYSVVAYVLLFYFLVIRHCPKATVHIGHNRKATAHIYEAVSHTYEDALQKYEGVACVYEAVIDAFGRLLLLNGIWKLLGIGVAQENIAQEKMGVWLAVGQILLITLIELVVFAVFSACGYILGKRRKCEKLFLDNLPIEIRDEQLKQCYMQGKPVYYTEELSDIIIRNSHLGKQGDTPVLYYPGLRTGLVSQMVKRLLDIIGSVVFLVILSPLFLIIACCIKLEDGGTIFYRQCRCTKDMREFNIYKFRSMRMNAEAPGEPRFAEADDERLTRIGRLIRNTKLDELPQLVNILRGDMSFVGPRPERPEFIEQILKDIPEFTLRTRVKAGLTGYAQVMGNYNTPFLDKLKWDLIYIEKQSLLFDFKIILMTLGAVMKGNKK